MIEYAIPYARRLTSKDTLSFYIDENTYYNISIIPSPTQPNINLNVAVELIRGQYSTTDTLKEPLILNLNQMQIKRISFFDNDLYDIYLTIQKLISPQPLKPSISFEPLLKKIYVEQVLNDVITRRKTFEQIVNWSGQDLTATANSTSTWTMATDKNVSGYNILNLFFTLTIANPVGTNTYAHTYIYDADRGVKLYTAAVEFAAFGNTSAAYVGEFNLSPMVKNINVVVDFVNKDSTDNTITKLEGGLYGGW